jgi:hypothetical protein
MDAVQHAASTAARDRVVGQAALAEVVDVDDSPLARGAGRHGAIGCVN